TYSHAFATGIYTVGNLCSIERNLIKLGNATRNGENVGIALYMGSGCRISNNDIVFDKWLTWGRNFGIWTKLEKENTL
ncbi:TPA: right-handed parallel beta-helix repeat-containing protein, partial [Legionella pneumophila]